MYLKIKGRRCPCVGVPVLSGDTLRFSLLGAGPTLSGKPSGVLSLCRDDGFELRTVDVDGYLRWAFSGGELMVTTLPEPEPVPPAPPVPPTPPLPSVPSTEDALVEAVVALQFDLDKMKLGGTTV